MEELLNTLFDKHSEGYGVYDRKNLIKDICEQLHDLPLHKTQVIGSYKSNCKHYNTKWYPRSQEYRCRDCGEWGVNTDNDRFK